MAEFDRAIIALLFLRDCFLFQQLLHWDLGTPASEIWAVVRGQWGSVCNLLLCPWRIYRWIP